MRNLKKVLALTLVFALVLSLSVSAFAASYPDQGSIDSRYTNAVEILSQLNVIKGDENGNLKPTGTFTRAEAAKIVADTYLGGNGDAAAAYAAAPTTVYPDVPTSAWYAGAAYFMQYMGVMSHTGAGLFEPNREISRIEVAGLVLGLVGYDNEVQGYSNNAQWKLNIQRDASFVHLYDDISSSTESITRQEVFQMVVNGLMTDSIFYNPATGKSEFSTEKSVLDVRFPNYEQIEGVLLSNKYASVGTGVTGKVVIDVNNVAANATIENISDAVAPVSMLGKEVRLFAKKTTTANLYNGALGVCTDLSSTKDLLGNEDAITGPVPVYVNYDSSTNLSTTNPKAFGVKDTNYTEAYGVRSGNTYNAIYANVYDLVKVTVVTGGKVTAVEFNGTKKVIDAVAAADFENGTTLAVGDVAMILRNSDKKPITATVVAPQTGVLTSVTNNKVTLSGTQYSVLTAKVNFRDAVDGAAIGASDNFGVSNTYYLFNGKVVEYVGAEDADKTFAMVIDVQNGGNTASVFDAKAKVKLLKDDNTTGIYTLKKLTYYATGDGTKTDEDGENVEKDSSRADTKIVPMGTAGAVPYSYVINSDGTVSLTEVEEIAYATGMTDGDDDFFSYTKGNSSMRVDTGKTYTVNGDTRVYVKDGTDYYAFIGKTLPDTGSAIADDVTFVRDGAVLKHVALETTGFKSNKADDVKGYVTEVNMAGSGSSKVLTLTILNIDTGVTSDYTVKTNLYHDDDDLVDIGSGTARTYWRQHIITFNQDSNGIITSLERTQLTGATAFAATDNSYKGITVYDTLAGAVIGGTSAFTFESDIVVIDLRNDNEITNTNVINDDDKALASDISGGGSGSTHAAFEGRYAVVNTSEITYLVITDDVTITKP